MITGDHPLTALSIAKDLSLVEDENEISTGVELNEYLKKGKLKVELFGRGMAWLDTGTHRSMLAAANFVEAVQTRQGLYVACIEEIAYRNGFIDKEKLLSIAQKLKKTEYGQYLFRLAEEN